MWFFKKTSPRRSLVRKSIYAGRSLHINRLADTDIVTSLLIWLLFIITCIPILSFDSILQARFLDLTLLSVIVILISLAAAFYIHHYQKRIIKNHSRAIALVGLFIFLLAVTKIGMLSAEHTAWATATAVTAAIILAISYNQRFAIGMSIFYCLFACFAVGLMINPNAIGTKLIDEYQLINFRLFLTMSAGAVTCCFSLREIRTRMKLLEVGTSAGLMVFITALALGFLAHPSGTNKVFSNAGIHAGVTIGVSVLIQGLLPLIEKMFRIATSMTLLDFSDANQPLLKKLAMEAPGTFSHSLLIGSIAEAAAEAIGRNGLLCRVGAYYHDIGKISKPTYFIENQMGLDSRHKELSPAMSQLIIVGHVKDGIEMAKEYKLPAVLRQFIETHHGTTLVEPFYNLALSKAEGEAKKKHEAHPPQNGGTAEADVSSGQKSRQAPPPPPSESEFRYAGPRPRTKEAAIVMLADTVEGAVRSLGEPTPTKIEAVVHNMAMKRLLDGQFDECDMSLRELSQIEASMSKTLAAHYHGRIAYPKAPDEPDDSQSQQNKQAERKRQLTV
jgi:putative nucleotidyltransferase with HDIG domain